MIIKISKYKHQKEVIKLLIDNRSESDKISLIGEISLATMVPIIVVCHFFGELYGITPELLKLMESIKKFYGITMVDPS